MKLWLEIQRRSGIEKRRVTAQDHVGLVEGPCPGCGEDFAIQCANMRRQGNRYIADARCVRCNDPVGYCYAEPDTLFGLAEDEAVAIQVVPRGGRVYG